jgi:hypothetical protein
MRDLIAIIHRESGIPNRDTQMDLVQVSSRRRSRRKCDVLLSRCGIGVVQLVSYDRTAEV